MVLKIVQSWQRLSGWRRHGGLAVAGALSALAMAPFFFWPILWLTLPALVLALDAAIPPRDDAGVRGWRRFAAAASCGWSFGFGYFLAGLFWVGEAFLVEPELFAWLAPFAVLLLPAGMALFYAAATTAAAALWRGGFGRILALAAALSAAEWLRGHLFTGFPWNVLGYALTAPDVLMQSAALAGVYALTLVAVVVFAGPAALWLTPAMRRDRATAALALAVVPIATLGALGIYRLSQPVPPDVAGVRLRLVQPSIPQREKWMPGNQRSIFEKHLALSAGSTSMTLAAGSGITHIIWPEAAMPFLPLDTPEALAAIAGLLPPGTALISGALRVTTDGARRLVFNSLIAFDDEAKPAAVYDKIHLVPFGEYLPFQPVLEAIGLRQLTRLRGGFDVGPSPRPLLKVAGLPPAAPLICYEAIFPTEIVEGAERPGWLLNVTNDGWFGNTTGPRQHFHQARVRAVEQGLPLVRVANNGISGITDAYGRVLRLLPLDVAGTIDTPLPGALAPPPYARWGDIPFAFLLLGAALCAVLAAARAEAKG